MAPIDTYLNLFSDGIEALDMTVSEEFVSLKQSARDLGISVPAQARYTSRNTVFRHQRFHFLDWGDRESPAVVLLHGGNQSAHAWDLVSLNLSAYHRVFALDQRGHGDSEWNRGAHYGVDDMALDARTFLEQIVSSSPLPVLVGHSMGGMVSMALACAHPEAIRALVIVDIGPEVNAEGTKMIRDFVGRNIEFDDMEEFLDRVEKYDPYRKREHIARTVKYNLLRRADGRYVAKADRRRFQSPAGNVRLPGVPALDDLKRLTMPVLVVRGAESNVLQHDAAVRFADLLPRGELVEVPDCGHNVASQNTTDFLRTLHAFLARV